MVREDEVGLAVLLRVELLALLVALLVEVDPQGSLIQCFGIDRFDLHHGLFGCLTTNKPIDEVIETDMPPRTGRALQS